jgi:hypothetical protein
MTSWSLPALLVLGILCGPHALNLLTSSVLQLLDPIVAMALALVGVCVGLSRPRMTVAAAMCAIGGPLVLAVRDLAPSSALLVTVTAIVVAVFVAFAGWLLVAQTDSEGEQQVFVVGSLLLLGGTAAYLSASALFAGLLAGLVWSSAGGLAKTRIVRKLDYFQHPLVVLLLVAAGASIAMSYEFLVLAAIAGALHLIFRPITEPFPVSLGLVALALSFDIFRGVAG